MPGLTGNQKIAKQKRLLTTDNWFRKVDDSFVSQGNAVDERYLNEYIQSLFGDDDWCGPDIVDKNEVDLTYDEVILSEIEADLDNSNEKILERWRESVSRQDDSSFLRRGDSERNKRQRSQNKRDLNDAAAKLQKLTSFYSSTTTSSVHTSHRNVTEVIEETMEDIMLDELGDSEENED